jgi:dTDP-4-dehydrorhamnose 3,5-epimerase
MANNTVQYFEFRDLDIEGLKLITPFFVRDERGYFIKSFEEAIYTENGINLDITETFETRSKKNIVRGLHFQTMFPQSKLISVSIGKIFDIAVDLRKNSSTYGHWLGFELSEDKMNALYLPAGFAHGFISLSDISIVNYKCSGKYLKEYDTGIVWKDSQLAIKWPVEDISDVITSKRDSSLMTFTEFDSLYGGL